MRRFGEYLEGLAVFCIVATFVAAAVLLLSSCGGGSKASHPKMTRGVHSCVPAEGKGTMGACAPTPATLGPMPTLSGRIVPDVSYFQGTVDWRTAKPHIAGAIVRVADGNFADPQFPRNWRELRRLHIWHATYFFLRPGDCRAEADRAVLLVRRAGGFDSGPLIADAEVPLNYGCAAAFVAEALRLTGLPEVIYTAPGTWPPGPHGHALLWVASYGPTPGCVWTCAHVAWQFTDGQVGPSPHCTPGIGCDDLSVDRGITRLGAKPKPPVTRAQKARSLHAHERDARVWLRLVVAHKCWRATPVPRRSYRQPCRRWQGKLAHDRHVIARYRREGVR